MLVALTVVINNVCDMHALSPDEIEDFIVSLCTSSGRRYDRYDHYDFSSLFRSATQD